MLGRSAATIENDKILNQALNWYGMTQDQFHAKCEYEQYYPRVANALGFIDVNDDRLAQKSNDYRVTSALNSLCQQFDENGGALALSLCDCPSSQPIAQATKELYNNAYQALLAFAQEHLSVGERRKFIGLLKTPTDTSVGRFTPPINLEAAPTLQEFIRQAIPAVVAVASKRSIV